MIIKKALTQKDYFECVSLRVTIFHYEQQIEMIYIFDEEDTSCLHYIVYDDQKAIASCRAVIQGSKVKLGRFCVLKDYRRHHVGRDLMDFVKDDLRNQGIEEIYLDAQETAIKFYQRIGFKEEGEPFEEAGIMHTKMVISL